MNTTASPATPAASLGRQALNPVAASLTYARSALLDLLHKAIHRRRRNSSQVASDYDQGQWHDELEAKGWERYADIDDYLLHRRAPPMQAIVDGRLTRLSAHDYYSYRTKLLTDVLASAAGDAETLVELGSGTGRNLFTLARSGHWKKVIGLELSATGREVTRRIAAHSGIDSVESGHIDLLDPSSEGYARLRGAVVFTFYCLEQLPSQTETVLRNLIDAGVRRVIFIEPTLELFKWWRLKDLATILYVLRQDYQRTLVRAVQALADAGRVRILEVRRLHFAPTCRNDPTLIVWEPN
jgi:SAM-dependent methyltransferase